MPYGYGTSKDFSPSPSGGGGADRDKKKIKFNFKPPSVRAAEAVVKGIKNAVKEYKADKMLGTADYQGSPTGRKSRVKPTLMEGGGNDRDPQYKPETTIKPISSSPTSQEISQVQSTQSTQSPTMLEDAPVAMSEKQKKIRVGKKGRQETILNTAQGLGNNNLIIKRNKLGG